MTTYRRLVNYVKPHFTDLCVAYSSMAVNSLLSGLPAAGLIIPFVDTVLAGKPIMVPHQDKLPPFLLDWIYRINAMPRGDLLNQLIFWTVSLALLRLVFEFLQSYFMNRVSQKVIRDLRNEVYAKMVHLPLSFFGRSQAGVLVSRITHDTVIVRDAISEGLADFLFQPIQIAVNLIVLLFIRRIFGIPWTLVFLIFVLLPMIVVPVMRVGRRLKKISRESQEQVAQINTTLYETFSGIRIVQGFSMEDYEKERFRKQNQAFYKTMMMSIGRMIFVSPLTEFVGFLCFGIVLWIGGKEVILNGMSPGAFIAFLVALFSLLRPFKRLSRVHSINQQALAAAERVFEITDTPNEIEDAPNGAVLAPIKNEIKFSGVNFSYGKDKQVLSNVDFSVRAGQVVALVGPSGGGKTTLVNLLPRFHDPVTGSVTIDGTDIRKVTLRSLRDQIGLVTQETILFNDTVSANIAYGRSETSHHDIENAARVANAHDFIMRMPDKYQTIIGDRGMKLSGGERQRLSIARAVLKNPPILILDEATSALDTESEMLVQDAIQKLMKGRTVLVIAHRLSTIKNADRILVLEGGKVAETGSHDELVKQDGIYRRLYELQFRV